MFYKLGRAGRVLRAVRRDRLRDDDRPGRARRAAHRQGLRGRRRAPAGTAHATSPAYDAVVLDAPPTGRIAPFLNVNAEVAGLAKVGPIRNQADSIIRLLRSPQTAVHLVTLLEEMPVQETLDARRPSCAPLGLPVGRVVVNKVRDPLLRPRELTAAAAKGAIGPAPRSRAGLAAAGLRGDRRRSSTGCSPRRRARAPGRAGDRASARTLDDARAGRCTSCRSLADGVDLGGLVPAGRRAARAGRCAVTGAAAGARRDAARLPPAAHAGASTLDAARCADPATPASSCAAARAGSARRPPPPRSGCGRPSAAAASSC